MSSEDFGDNCASFELDSTLYNVCKSVCDSSDCNNEKLEQDYDDSSAALAAMSLTTALFLTL